MLESIVGFIFTIIGLVIACTLVSYVYSFFEKLKIPWLLKLWLSIFILSGIGAAFIGLWGIFSSLSIFFLNIISRIPVFIAANQLWIGISVICLVLLFTFVEWKKSIIDQKDRKILEASLIVENLIDVLNNRWEKWEQ